MKKRVGILNGTPIVEGDPNLLSNKELLHKGGGSLAKRNIDGKVEDLGGGSGSGNSTFYHYYKVPSLSENSNSEIAYMLLGYYPILGISMRGFNDVSIGIGGNTSSLEILTAHELFRRNIISTNNVSCAVKISDDSYNFVGSSEESSIIPEGDFFSKAEVLLKAMGTPENDIPNVMPMIKECITPITEEEYLNFNGE